MKTELEALKNKGQFRTIPNINSKEGKYIIIDNKKYINLASNDYLGISTNIDLRDEFIKSNNSLLSSASARLLTGSSSEFSQLEKTLCNMFNKEKSLIFNTGYQANLGVISAMVKKGDVVFSDKLNHASIIDGMQLSKGDFYRYKHFDYDNLENLLIKHRHNYKRAIIVSESIFSMDGDGCDIQRLIELKQKYDCLLMIDEAHAFCCFGDKLQGYTEKYNKNIDIITATFGKAVGSFGAFCVANSDIIDYLINNARSFIFSTSIPPINIAWTNWLLNEKKNILFEQKKKLDNLTFNAHKILKENNISTVSCSQIIPIIIGTNEATINVAERLKSEGYYIPAIRPPTVPEGTSRLRISLTANINISDFKRVLEIIL